MSAGMGWHDLALLKPFLAERHLDLAREAETFARERLAGRPEALTDEAARVEARELLGELGRAGLCRWAIPEAWGGVAGAPDALALCLIREALAAASPLADSVFALQGLGSMPLTLSGNDAARARWLGRVAAGEAMAAFAMTEPEAGSDVASMTTLAHADGDGYVLEGGKHLITNAGVADYYVVFAQTAPGAGAKGIGAFLVEAGDPGLTFVRAQVLSSPHPLGELAFRGCRVGAEAVLGGPGEGFKLGLATLDRLRPTVAAAACGMAARALEEALAHARGRRQFGRPLAEHQLVQARLAEMATELAAARLLTYRAAWEIASGAPRATYEAAMAKSYAAEAAQRVVDGAVQILGGRGVLVDHPVDRLYRSIRALRIYEGTTEIQHLVIARELLKRSQGA
ncbi:MAG TPA: acyl-CoA dehydrogenase family protein [Thermoanaerobaculia bacterium]|nr:acyl-CoA dehydrogenase family protein [Thermoanaerobaculia bacterium]